MIYVFPKKHITVLVGKQQMVFPFVHSTNIPQDSYYVPSTMMGAEKSRANTSEPIFAPGALARRKILNKQ